MTNSPPPSTSHHPLATPENWRSYWSLDPAITFLNHGSFGACPIPVLEQQQAFRSQLEAEPVRFFESEFEPLLDASRQELASFIGATAADLVFIPNATTGVNTVLRSLCWPLGNVRPLQSGDELLTTNHEYNASRNALNFVAQYTGATVVIAKIPFPLASTEEAIEALLAKVTPRTRLVLLDHVTSQTGLVFPLQTLVKELSSRNIEVLVDGAHAPGMIPLNLKESGVAYYTGNCHKWLCAPKGAAFLYIRPDQQSAIRPLTISHGANSPRSDRSAFHLEFDWTGTGDPTPYLCVAKAIQFLGSLLPQGWTGLMAHNRSRVLEVRQQLCQILNIPVPCPEALIGSMATIPLPNGSSTWLQSRLLQHYGIEVPIIPWQEPPFDRLLRVSVQIYNTVADYDRLAKALLELLTMEQAERKDG